LEVDLLRDLHHIQFVPIDATVTQDAAEIAADRALRGADAVYVAVARRYGCALVTLDREQRERAAPIDLLSFSAHKAYDPKGVGGICVQRSRP
jgi:predicted nucleic acid-binding protein